MDGFSPRARVEQPLELGNDLRLLRPVEVARMLGVSRTWLYDAARDGRIPCVRIGGPGGPLRFVPQDLDNWLDQARASWLPGRRTRALGSRRSDAGH